jgi:hypothetical protein
MFNQGKHASHSMILSQYSSVNDIAMAQQQKIFSLPQSNEDIFYRDKA